MYFFKDCEICFHLDVTAGIAILLVWEPGKRSIACVLFI